MLPLSIIAPFAHKSPHILPVKRLKNRSIDLAIERNPVDLSHARSLADRSIKQVLSPVKACVGFFTQDGDDKQISSCTLIAHNLGLIAFCGESPPKHVTFSAPNKPEYTAAYRVLKIVEKDIQLGYAILQLDGMPGKVHGMPHLSAVACLKPSALLHHPRPEALRQVSVASARVCDADFLTTEHDAEKGSSGGAYIDPESRLFAIHLFDNKALTLHAIATKSPRNILRSMLEGTLLQQYTYADTPTSSAASPK